MANDQVLTAEQVIDKARKLSKLMSMSHLSKRHMNLRSMLIVNNIENLVSHILFIRFKLQGYLLT